MQTVKKHRQDHTEYVLTQIRMQKILSHTVFNNKYRPYFYIDTSDPDKNALIFTFENDAMIDEDFSEIVLAKLSVEEKNLTLTLWPHKHDKAKEIPTKMQKEILLQNVEKLKISLFKPGDKEAKQSDHPHPVYNEWTNQWPAEYGERPALVHLACNKGDFWFIIPQEIQPVRF